MQKQINMGDILRKYGAEYINRNNIQGQEKGIIKLLSACRTPAMDSHYQKCTQCEYTIKAPNSCRNRHCPICQQKDKLQWLEKRMDELLPIGYYHLVFTIPHKLNALCLQNKKVMYGILFKAASQTLLELCKDTKHMGADTGLITVLHTWGQNMMDHPHLHVIMPTGGLSFDKEQWIEPTKKKHKDFFIYYKVVSEKFRGKFLDLMKKAYADDLLTFKGNLSTVIAGNSTFNSFVTKLFSKDWVVNIQRPFGKPEKVLEYLSRYVFRIAITNRRIIEVKNGKVLFSWKDYRTNTFKKMSLTIDEFIRRFLLHLLPKGFFKVRYFGIFSSRYRKVNIETAKKILLQNKELQKREDIEDSNTVWQKQDTVWDAIQTLIKDYKQYNCPCCKKGHLRYFGVVPG
jgi:hypothetical protein